MANFPGPRCTLGSSFTVKIFHVVNITLTHASCRTVNSRPRMKGALCLSRNQNQSGSIQPIFACFHGYKKITYIHSIGSFLAKGNISITVHLPSPPQTRGIRKENPGCARGPPPLTQQHSERRGHAYLKHGCVSWRQCVCTEACKQEGGESSPVYLPKHLKTWKHWGLYNGGEDLPELGDTAHKEGEGKQG